MLADVAAVAENRELDEVVLGGADSAVIAVVDFEVMIASAAFAAVAGAFECGWCGASTLPRSFG